MEIKSLDKEVLKELKKCEAEKYVIKQELQREKDNTIKSMFDKWSNEIYNEKFDNKPIPIKKSKFQNIKNRIRQVLRLK